MELLLLLVLLLFWQLPLQLFQDVPGPGKAVVFLAVAAGVMSLQPDMEPKHKVIWVLILFGFALVEIKSIDLDRAQHEREQAAARESSERNFKTIAAGIRNQMMDSDRKFQGTMAGITGLLHSTDKLSGLETGANSLCYFYPYVAPWTDNKMSAIFALFHRGDFPIHNLDYGIWDALSYSTNDPLGEGHVPACVRTMEHIAHFPLPEGRGKIQRFIIRYSAQNGVWREEIQLRDINGTWEMALRVLAVPEAGAPKVIFEPKPSPGFPLAANGKVEWGY
jgi:hypothetical protein